MADFCSWATKIIPDDGFETRWTRSEKSAVLAYDINVAKFCRNPN